MHNIPSPQRKLDAASNSQHPATSEPHIPAAVNVVYVSSPTQCESIGSAGQPHIHQTLMKLLQRSHSQQMSWCSTASQQGNGSSTAQHITALSVMITHNKHNSSRAAVHGSRDILPQLQSARQVRCEGVRQTNKPPVLSDTISNH